MMWIFFRYAIKMNSLDEIGSAIIYYSICMKSPASLVLQRAALQGIPDYNEKTQQVLSMELALLAEKYFTDKRSLNTNYDSVMMSEPPRREVGVFDQSSSNIQPQTPDSGMVSDFNDISTTTDDDDISFIIDNNYDGGRSPISHLSQQGSQRSIQRLRNRRVNNTTLSRRLDFDDDTSDDDDTTIQPLRSKSPKSVQFTLPNMKPSRAQRVPVKPIVLGKAQRVSFPPSSKIGSPIRTLKK
jgi:hypothetical protein